MNTTIWTKKEFVSNEWPFQDEGENWTYFYKSLKDKKPFAQMLARSSDVEKKKRVSEILGISINSFTLKSVKSHYKAKK